MDEWSKGCMDEWVDEGWMDGWMDRKMRGWMYEYIKANLDGCMNG